MNPLPSLVTTVCGFFELGVPVSLETLFRRLSLFSARFSVFMAVLGHVEVVGGRLEGPHAVRHGGTRGERREVGGWG